MSKGIVIVTPTPTHDGELKVAEADSNGYNVTLGSKLYFPYNDGIAWKQNDAVEFTIKTEKTCDIPKKLTTYTGTVTLNPPDDRGGKVEFKGPVPNGFGFKEGDELWFQFIPPKPEPYPTVEGDTIELIIVQGDKLGMFVQVL
jgi:hypothetical protein